MATQLRSFFRFSRIVSTTFFELSSKLSEAAAPDPAATGDACSVSDESEGLPRYDDSEAYLLLLPEAVEGVFGSGMFGPEVAELAVADDPELAPSGC
jgi:hypothetical protein